MTMTTGAPYCHRRHPMDPSTLIEIGPQLKGALDNLALAIFFGLFFHGLFTD